MNGNDQLRNTLYDRTLRLWAVEETILHSYAGKFLVFQAALFLSAVIVLYVGDRPAWYTQFLFFAIAAVGLATTILWALLSLDRANAVQYLSDRLRRLEKGAAVEEDPFTAFRCYREENNLWRQLCGLLLDVKLPKGCCQIGRQGGTSCILSFVLPAALGALWLCIISVYAYLLTAPQIVV